MYLLGTNFSFRHWRHLGDSRSPARGGGVERFRVTFEFPGRNSRLFIILASEERVPKQFKQVSIVGKKKARKYAQFNAVLWIRIRMGPDPAKNKRADLIDQFRPVNSTVCDVGLSMK